jgi:DNA-binding NarL/FixJ family response regulator
MLTVLVVEDSERLQPALVAGLNATQKVQVVQAVASGEKALEYITMATDLPDAVLMDVALAGDMNGIEAAVVMRREFPRLPVVFYSIQDDDAHFRSFLTAGILSHYAYVRKSNYLLPDMIVPLLEDAVRGHSFVDPDVEARVHAVRQRDQNNPMNLLEPNEQIVARLLAQGLTNEQIAAQLGFRDKRTISRTNGQIYAAWNLIDSTTDEKIARTRAAIIVHTGRILRWDEQGKTYVLDRHGSWIDWGDI